MVVGGRDLKNILRSATKIKAPRGSHIYFLMFKDTIVYVGKSNSLLSRVGSHNENKEFDSVLHIPVSPEDQDSLELGLIKTIKPKYNLQPLGQLKEKEIHALNRYCFGDEVLKYLVRGMPTVEKGCYGQVIFLNEEGEVEVGLYDNDSTEEEEHFDACEYQQALDCLSEDISDELAYALREHCNCSFAIVYDSDFKYRTIPHSELRVPKESSDEIESLFGNFTKRFFEGFTKNKENENHGA